MIRKSTIEKWKTSMIEEKKPEGVDLKLLDEVKIESFLNRERVLKWVKGQGDLDEKPQYPGLERLRLEELDLYGAESIADVRIETLVLQNSELVRGIYQAGLRISSGDFVPYESIYVPEARIDRRFKKVPKPLLPEEVFVLGKIPVVQV